MHILTKVGIVSAVAVPFGAATYVSYTRPVPVQSRKIKISELPIYEVPETARVTLIPEEIGTVRGGISAVRQSVWGWLDTQRDTTEMLREKLEIGKAHTEATISTIRADEGVNVPKISVIGASGLVGIVLGYRGSIFKKTGYSLFLMLATAALCYPTDAVDMSKQGFNKVKTAIKDQFSSKDDGKD
ncbi:MICOS complex subunit MIC27-like [Mya arenaria]|uniref:MICOS complex subunit MIC27-like n=1 Tax=Mya arenaria TaxID=6604 RepID=UPI0022E1E010|nr:MICOS complex subunit MIC27-like [Mya arenaria]